MARKKGRRSQPFKIKLKKDTVSSIAALIVMAFGGLISISFSRQGPILSAVYDFGSRLIGWSFIILPFIFVSGGLLITKVKWQIAKPTVFAGSLVAMLSLTGLTRAGTIGSQVYFSVSQLITPYGAALFFFTGTAIGLLVLFETSLEDIVGFIQSIFASMKKAGTSLPKVASGKSPRLSILPREEMKVKGMVNEDVQAPKNRELDLPQEARIINNQPGTDQLIWELPPLSLLSDEKKGKADRGNIKENAGIIERTLESFGIEAHVVEVNLGPAVTQYAIKIAIGTKLSKITNLQNDLALALSAPQGQIRIEAPIPGRDLVGIEVPNRTPEFVSLKHILTSDIMRKNKSKLAVALGLNVAGEPTIADIDRMPHVLVAGATGSGKSVCINSFIASILFRASPSEVKFIMVDPKRVELTGYNGIPHLLTPVITEPEKVVAALKWAITEMDRRYKLFAEVGVRNIGGYNELSGFQAMPYIVIIIDELADVMLFAPSEVEDCVTRLAQMARAVGLHLVLATQRPSVDVITGLIKANIPTRIAFNVASMMDSRVIIDSPGAEKLLGRGDMLYIPPTDSKPRRIQGTFLEDNEIAALIKYLQEQGIQPEYTDEVTKSYSAPSSSGSSASPLGDLDEMFEDAVRVSIDYEKASASLLQRRLSIGYARAARIIDQMEKLGVVSAPDGSKHRDVLIKNADEFFARIQEAA